jgi:hypothetical protein
MKAAPKEGDMSAHYRRRSKVIGYFAYESPTQVVCTGEACVIAGSRLAMKQYISEIDPNQRTRRTIKKTTFAEIKHGLELGAAYAFDKAAYKRFYPLASGAGLSVMEPNAADYEKHAAAGERFLIIHLQTL